MGRVDVGLIDFDRPQRLADESAGRPTWMAGHDRQHLFSDGVIRADDFDLGVGKPGFAELLQRRINGLVGGSRACTVIEIGNDVQKPHALLGRFDPEGGLYGVTVGGEPLHEPAAIVDLISYQRALIHGNIPFSMAS